MEVILFISFFDRFMKTNVPSLLQCGQFFQFCVQSAQIFFQLRQKGRGKVVPIIKRLPEFLLHPPDKHRLEHRFQRLHPVFQRHAHLRPAHIRSLPRRDVVPGQIVPHFG